jgi:EpsI family protein
MKRWPVLVAFLMLAGTWALLQSLSYGEQAPDKKPFAEFPVLLAGRWEGREMGLDEEVLRILRVSDFMMRAYHPRSELQGAGTEASAAQRAPVYLYVGYYQSQRTGASYHSPKNCLPGAGWQFVESTPIAVNPGGRAAMTINRAVIQKGLDKQLIYYWYQDRGRIIASEYWAKGYLIMDAMTRHRTDGALVRISISVVSTMAAAEQEAMAFLEDVWDELVNYMPSGDFSA